MLWSGQQIGARDPATRKQQIVLADASGVTPLSEGRPIDSGIYIDTIYGNRVALNDKEQSVTVSGKVDPSGNIANSIKIEDKTGKITIKTSNPVPQTIVMDGLAGTIAITSPSTVSVSTQGAITLGAMGGIAMASGAAPPTPPAPGVAVENGQGAKIINFIGSITETVADFTQNAAAVLFNAVSFTVTSPFVQLGPIPTFGVSITLLPFPLIIIGDIATATKLANAELLTWLETHTHTGNLGFPTPVTPIQIVGTPTSLKDPLNPSQPNPLYLSKTLVS
jgi:hypothetical protein